MSTQTVPQTQKEVTFEPVTSWRYQRSDPWG